LPPETVFGPCRADQHRDTKSQKDVLGGKAWGNTGAYEKSLIGTAHFTIDPKAVANKNIPDIDKAPRNAQGA